MTALVVVDDDQIVRIWLRAALPPAGFRVVGEGCDAASTFDVVRDTRPDALLVDEHLGEEHGVDLVRRLRVAGVDAPIVLMTALATPGLNERARAAGAQGCVVKSANVATLVTALRAACAGRTVFDRRHPGADGVALSRREREALRLVAAGATNPMIGARLGVSPETAKTLLRRAFSKLGVTRRAEAAAVATRLGLI